LAPWLSGSYHPGVACPVGQFASGLASDCALCAVDSIAASAGSAECTVCAPGEEANSGRTFCSVPCDAGARSGACVCSAGTYEDSTGVCQYCAVGRYSSDDTGCVDCTPGKIGPAPGMDQCVECADGQAQDAAAQYACAECLPGMHSGSGATECGICEPGKVAAQRGMGACDDCAPGKFSLGAAADDGRILYAVCEDCAAGKFSDTGSTICRACLAGQHQAGVGMEYCDVCLAGSFSQAQEVAAEILYLSCENCLPGRFSDGNSTECPACAPGQHTTREGMPTCIECEAGQFSLASTATPSPTVLYLSCESCAVGLFSCNGSEACGGCQPGRVAPAPGMGACDTCSAGKFSKRKEGPGPVLYVSCQNCPAGLMSANASIIESQCEMCPTGQYTNGDDNLGTDRCHFCETGSMPLLDFVLKDRRIGCEYCAQGSYGPDGINCKECSAGRYGERPGQVECENCRDGHYTKVAGLFICAACCVGTEDNFNRTGCDNCADGFVSNGTICVQCAHGQFTPGNAEACQTCEKGKTNSENLTHCVDVSE
jgi:hypothetical protein